MARALILVSSEIDNEIDVEHIIEQNLELQVSDIVQQIEVECKNAGIETDDENLWWLTIDNIYDFLYSNPGSSIDVNSEGDTMICFKV